VTGTTAPRAPGRPRSAVAERAIRDAAVELLVDRGIGGFSVEAVAARAGVAKTTIYRRWPTREQLIVAVVSGLKAPTQAAPGESVRGDLVDVLRQAAASGTSTSWARLMARLAMEADDHPQLVTEIWQHAISPRQTYLRGILGRGVAEGSIRADADLELVTDMLVSPVVARVRQRRDPLTDAQIAELVDIVLAGLRP
jgi:AcrR family transcriptional regulator